MSRDRSHRQPSLCAVAAVVLLLGIVALPSAAAAAEIVKPIVFPVDGPVTYTDTFGAPRTGHTHEGQDLMGAKMLPLLSAVDGIVHRVKFDNAIGNSVTIKAADGWTYHYIHVNNDRPGTDDGQATRDQAFPPNIVAGAAVTKGQVIAYLGDSGNAENAGSHLHFEIRQPALPGGYQGAPINPYASLQAATVWATTQRWELRRTPAVGPTHDTFVYGVRSDDLPLLCDWDGDGSDEAVIYRAGRWYVRDGVATGATAYTFVFGTSVETPLCGNIDADRADEPMLFARGGTWTIRAGFGASDPVAWTARYGVLSGDKPVVGDWDGNGKDDLAVLRSGTWHLRSSANATGGTVRTFPYGSVSVDRPVAGDWDGNGKDDAGIYRNGRWYLRSSAEVEGRIVASFVYGTSIDAPVAGNWTSTTSGLGVFRRKS